MTQVKKQYRVKFKEDDRVQTLDIDAVVFEVDHGVLIFKDAGMKTVAAFDRWIYVKKI